MKPGTKLIFACDISDEGDGLSLIRKVSSEVDVFKIGLEAMTAENDVGQTLAYSFRQKSLELKKPVMWDMKFDDIGNTVGKATRNIVELHVPHYRLFKL